MRQRFRWSFGILQAVWKHGKAIRKRSRLGWIALPNIIVFQIMLPLLSPFIDLMFVFGTPAVRAGALLPSGKYRPAQL